MNDPLNQTVREQVLQAIADFHSPTSSWSPLAYNNLLKKVIELIPVDVEAVEALKGPSIADCATQGDVPRTQEEALAGALKNYQNTTDVQAFLRREEPATPDEFPSHGRHPGNISNPTPSFVTPKATVNTNGEVEFKLGPWEFVAEAPGKITDMFVFEDKPYFIINDLVYHLEDNKLHLVLIAHQTP